MGKGSENGRTGVDSCAWWPQTIRESYNLCSSTSLDNHFTRNRKSERRRCRRWWGLQRNEHDKFLFGPLAPFEVPFPCETPQVTFADGSALYGLYSLGDWVLELTHTTRFSSCWRQLVNKIVNCHFVLLSSSPVGRQTVFIFIEPVLLPQPEELEL